MIPSLFFKQLIILKYTKFQKISKLCKPNFNVLKVRWLSVIAIFISIILFRSLFIKYDKYFQVILRDFFVCSLIKAVFRFINSFLVFFLVKFRILLFSLSLILLKFSFRLWSLVVILVKFRLISYFLLYLLRKFRFFPSIVVLWSIN